MSAVRTIKIDAKVAWLAKQTSSAPERWMGVCEMLNIATEAESLDELHSLIPESIHLLITDLLEEDELDAFLREKGWRHTSDAPGGAPEDTIVSLPWQMIVEGNGDLERSAH